MPAANFMVIDARRDHSMRVPRPDQTVALGVPNACNNCHDKKDAPWAAAAVRSWYGRDAQGFQNFAPTFRNAELGKPGAGASLAAIAADPSQPAIARASALDRMQNTPATAAGTAARIRRPQQQPADAPCRGRLSAHRSRPPSASPSPRPCSAIPCARFGSKPPTRWSTCRSRSCPPNNRPHGEGPRTNTSRRRSTTPTGPNRGPISGHSCAARTVRRGASGVCRRPQARPTLCARLRQQPPMPIASRAAKPTRFAR